MNKILIVEDDPNILKIYQAFFSKVEFKIVVASDGQEGIFKFKNEIFDLVICDINLPKKNGLTLIKECMEAEKRQTSEHYQRHGKCAYIIASGSVDEKCRDMASMFNIDIIEKPFDCLSLINLAREKISRSQKKYNELQNESFILQAGDTLFNENEISTDVFYVWEGQLDIFAMTDEGYEIKIGEIKQNEFAGELSFFGHNTRISTVRAFTNTKLSLLPAQFFKSYFEKQPKWAQTFVAGLVKRLLECNENQKKNAKDTINICAK